MGEIRRPVGQPPKAGAFGRSPGPGGTPGRSLPSFCRYRKKVRRKGKRDKRPLERDRNAKGQTIAWQSKRTTLSQSKTLHLGPKHSPFKKRPCGPVLKDRQQKPQAPGAPREWVKASLVTGRGLSLREYKDTEGSGSCLSQRHIISRGLNRRMLPHFGEFRPLRRSTRRCPPWTRTGLMSGDRKASRYWALGFGYGAAPAETSPAPVHQRPGNRFALCSFGLQAPTSSPHTVKPRSGG